MRKVTLGICTHVLEESAFGNAVYVETQSVNTNSKGILSSIIGEGNVIQGELDNIDRARKSHLNKTEVDPPGGDNYALSGNTELPL